MVNICERMGWTFAAYRAMRAGDIACLLAYWQMTATAKPKKDTENA